MSNKIWGELLLVGLGGSAGAAVRHLASVLMQRWTSHFPWQTLAVNVAGCLVIGLLMGWGLTGKPGRLQLCLITGFLGALTTMSAYSLESVQLAERGEFWFSALYIAGTVLLCLMAVQGGAMMGRSWSVGGGEG